MKNRKDERTYSTLQWLDWNEQKEDGVERKEGSNKLKKGAFFSFGKVLSLDKIPSATLENNHKQRLSKRCLNPEGISKGKLLEQNYPCVDEETEMR